MRISKLVWIVVPLACTSACGGSSTRDESGDPMALIQDACDNIAGLSCPNGITFSECENELQDERMDAVEDGCGAEFDGLVSCFANAPLTCDGPAAGACEAEMAAGKACSQGPPTWQDDCGQSHSGYNPAVDPPGWEECAATCPSWKLVCERFDASAPFVCTCTEGPNTGASFEAATCGSLEVAKGFCG